MDQILKFVLEDSYFKSSKPQRRRLLHPLKVQEDLALLQAIATRRENGEVHYPSNHMRE